MPYSCTIRLFNDDYPVGVDEFREEAERRNVGAAGGGGPRGGGGGQGTKTVALLSVKLKKK